MGIKNIRKAGAPRMERPVGARAAGAGISQGAAQRLVTAGNGAQTKKTFRTVLKVFCIKLFDY